MENYLGHDLGMTGARAVMGEKGRMLVVDFCGLTFNTPLVLLSGCVGFGEEYTRVIGFSNRDAGAVCLKGTTLAPRLGHPTHRIAETPAGMLNAIGLQNPGARSVVDDILPRLDFTAGLAHRRGLLRLQL